MRIVFSLLRIIIVDTSLLHTGSRGPDPTMLQNEFHELLALELTENKYDAVGLCARRSADEGAALWTPKSDVDLH